MRLTFQRIELAVHSPGFFINYFVYLFDYAAFTLKKKGEPA